MEELGEDGRDSHCGQDAGETVLRGVVQRWEEDAWIAHHFDGRDDELFCFELETGFAGPETELVGVGPFRGAFGGGVGPLTVAEVEGLGEAEEDDE